MFVVLEALENADLKYLCFASRDDAERFKAFVNIYMEESGAGNGYGAYWVMFDADVEDVLEGFDTELNMYLLNYMMSKVIEARLADSEIAMYPAIEVSMSTGVIFRVGELPPRKRPTVGDMFRTLYSAGAESKFEGRVIHDNGDTFEVINCSDEWPSGKLKDNAKIITISVGQVMKVNDWRAKRRG